MNLRRVLRCEMRICLVVLQLLVIVLNCFLEWWTSRFPQGQKWQITELLDQCLHDRDGMSMKLALFPGPWTLDAFPVALFPGKRFCALDAKMWDPDGSNSHAAMFEVKGISRISWISWISDKLQWMSDDWWWLLCWSSPCVKAHPSLQTGWQVGWLTSSSYLPNAAHQGWNRPFPNRMNSYGAVATASVEGRVPKRNDLEVKCSDWINQKLEDQVVLM